MIWKHGISKSFNNVNHFLFVVATSLPFSYIFCSGQSFLSFLTEKIFTIGLDQTRASSDDAI